MLFVNVATLIAIVLVGHRHPHVRERAQVEVVAAHELEVEPVESVEGLHYEPAPVPTRVVAAPKPVVDAPDFRPLIARQLESMPICRRSDGPQGPGLAEVTYLPDGTVRISLSPNYANSAVGACVARRFIGAARPFVGEPQSFRVRFEV